MEKFIMNYFLIIYLYGYMCVCKISKKDFLVGIKYFLSQERKKLEKKKEEKKNTGI